MGCGERRKTMELPRRKARGAPGGARWGKTGGQHPKILLRWSRGSQDPDEAAQRLCHLHADGGDGVLQEQVEGCEEQSRDMRGGWGGTAAPPGPRLGPCPG